MTRRRTWLLVHRVNGLLLAGFLTIVGVTGSLLAWNAQLERAFAPALFVLPAHAVNAARVDPVLVREAIALTHPWARVDMLDLNTKPDLPLRFALTPKSDHAGYAQTGERDEESFADPYSGRVLGSRRDADLHEGWKNTMPFVYALHQNLALGNFGMMLLGAAALLWTLDCLVGMYLSFPASRRSVEQSLVKRARAWPRRFVPSLRMRWRKGPYKRLYDLHRASGVWFWAMLLIFAWTGVVFNLPIVAKPVVRAFGGIAEQRRPAIACSSSVLPQSEQDWRAAVAEARTRMQTEARRHFFDIREERFLSFDPAQCLWTFRVRSTRDIDQIGNTQIQWSAGASQQSFTMPTGITRADTVTTWMEAFHEAQLGGASLRVLVCAAGIVTAFLSITGVRIFSRKIRAQSRNDIQTRMRSD